MAYSDFTLERACRAFELTPKQEVNLHLGEPEVVVRPSLVAMLQEYVPLATSIHTEKARSEFIVAPILAEIRRLSDHQISLFSGLEFSVAPEKGLTGVCDFILAKSPVQWYLEAPVLMVVEAKNDNIKAGLGQCLAEMVAARMFNETHMHGPTNNLRGVVTTGTLWKFLWLVGTEIHIDTEEYHIDRLGMILAILMDAVASPDVGGAD